jgi:alkaline phosphatase D
MSLNRRRFLKVLAVYAGAVVAGGCDDDGSANPAADTLSDAPDQATDGDTLSDTTSGPIVKPGDAYFPQSVASGDPKAASVILWARVADADAAADADLTLSLEVGLDEALTQRVTLNGASSMSLTAEAAFDRCVKARVEGLDPATVYYYRFVYEKGGELFGSRIARTKTAPTSDADVPVRLAYASCQDMTGRYFNPYARLLQEDPNSIDFLLHLGDYVYETTGDSSFQETGGRSVIFGKPDEAIAFNAGTPDLYYAAKSLDNYRDLYRTYRADVTLQRVHERWPMVAIWDDHEFSDDSHGINATYFDGARDEADEARRKHANQAWFEYMPVDYQAGPEFRYDPDAAFPSDLSIYRDLRFGKHLHLVLTDLRTHRSDHLIPEDALPGEVALTEEALTQALGAVPAGAAPYVNIDDFSAGAYKAALRDNAATLGLPPDKLTGLMDIGFINGAIESLTADGLTALPPVVDDPLDPLPRGFAFLHMGKRSPYGALGARYFVIKPVFELYARLRYADSGGASEQALGEAQEAWFLQTMQQSTSTWKVWGNEFCLGQLAVDLTSFTSLPPAFAQQFLLSVEDWAGMPNRRDALLTALSALPNVVALTGDIHAFFASVPSSSQDPTKHIVELVGAGISSASYRQLLLRTANGDPVLAASGAAALAAGVESLLLDRDSAINPHLAFANADAHGFVTVTVGADALEATFWITPASNAKKDLTADDAAIAGAFTTEQFKVVNGESALQRLVDGQWQRWDTATLSWVAP